ncbi:condensin complex subunit 3 isoform X2 [Selaginella moellendorffii]|uniref:condensin complex subunit 3 isoform X2 n=1 Tax=Selaginella moellendorffii TaxID=88036 RepID=UPI000D1CF1D3|nr:condensin complex subunit 3 isoform X2 [Selaginella moellendorffii]|eukprot:XP_024527782.1 condensin complex subunit 3 isoform X2 [Selaginella moellendorffii]
MRVTAAMDSSPEALLVRIFNECQQTHASHRRHLKDLVKSRRQQDQQEFAGLFKRFVTPIFDVMKKEPAVERIVKFVASVVTFRDENAAECDAFLEDFVDFLLSAVDSSNKSVRYRSCQILSEVIMMLGEDTEVNAELWDEMTAAMERRIQDKIAGIRVFAARSLGRLFSDDKDNSQYRLSLQFDPSPDVRKAALLAIPVLNTTISDIVSRTGDVSAAVRKAAYSVIRDIPIQSLSIRQRALVLQRGLLDRESTVQVECRSMLKDGWLTRDCQKDPLILLKLLDVETNEKAGELVMQQLLTEDCMGVDNSQSLRDYLDHDGTNEGKIRFMEPEEALYWRTLCAHLHSEAQAKSSDAAKSRGAQADVLEAVAADKAQLLDSILPATVAEFVTLVEAHHTAGSSQSFVSRQLLLLANVLDFSDMASRKCAAASINNFLYQWTSPDRGPEMTGDGIYLGGGKEWSDAFVQLAKKVHATPDAFEEAMAQAALDLGKVCREGGAGALQWLQCLATTGILLENLRSIRQFPAHVMETQEMVDGLLIPAANHLVADVRRAGVRCLSLYCLSEEHPSVRVIRQLEEALIKSYGAEKIMAIKGMFDLVMSHGAGLMDSQRASHSPGQMQLPLLQLLADILSDQHDIYVQEDIGETESARSVAAEGFAKLLLHSKRFPELGLVRSRVLSDLFRMYFDEDTKSIPRLGQCLSVFFHNYASATPEHKRCIAEVFVPVLRKEWPGLTGSACNSHIAAIRKKNASHLSRFMLELLKQPLFSQQNPDESADFAILAIDLAREIMRFSSRKTLAVKAYKSALCKVLVSLKFLPSRQKEIRAMRALLSLVIDEMAGEKLLLKELRAMAAELKSLDSTKDETIGNDELETLLASLGFLAEDAPPEAAPAKTPRKPKARAAPSSVSSDSSESGVQTPPKATASVARSQRNCKTVAMERMQSIRATAKSKMIDFESEESETTSEEELESPI